MDISVLLVGVGNMGGAMLRGWIDNGLKSTNINVLDPSPSKEMEQLLGDNKINATDDVSFLTAPDVMLIAVKPQMMDAVLPGLKDLVGKNTVVVSVAAGTRIEQIENHLGACAVIRTMPNTPSLVLRGMSVCCANDKATPEQKDNVSALMSAIGEVEWVDDEKLIDAVTAVSGSGPAYAFLLAECMAKAGANAGLSPELAQKLAIETVSGAGELMRVSEDTPDILREKVTSPNGTTAAALEVLMKEGGMPELLNEAIGAAKKRAEEL